MFKSNLTSKLLQLRSICSGNSGGGILFASRKPSGVGLLSSQSVSRQLSPTPIRFFSSGHHATTRPVNWGFKIVPQEAVAVVERFGKYAKTLDPGFHLLIPFVDGIKHVHSLKLKTICIPDHSAITKDNDHIHVKGILFIKIIDPKLASYGVEDPICSVIQLAQRTVGIVLRKLTFHEIIAHRILLQEQLLKSINEVAKDWGLQCLHYDIRDISMPDGVQASKVMAVAKLKKRPQNLDSEGTRQAGVGIAKSNKTTNKLAAEGNGKANIRAEAEEDAKAKDMATAAKRKKRVKNLDSEGTRQEEINVAKANKNAHILAEKGNAKMIRRRAQAEEVANATVHKAPDAEGGIEAASLMAAEKHAFSEPAEKGSNGHC